MYKLKCHFAPAAFLADPKSDDCHSGVISMYHTGRDNDCRFELQDTIKVESVNFKWEVPSCSSLSSHDLLQFHNDGTLPLRSVHNL